MHIAAYIGMNACDYTRTADPDTDDSPPTDGATPADTDGSPSLPRKMDGTRPRPTRTVPHGRRPQGFEIQNLVSKKNVWKGMIPTHSALLSVPTTSIYKAVCNSRRNLGLTR
jgi:hypothetical protein